MLQYSTIKPESLELLKQLMQIPELNNFSLVGGTALALRYGHRISVDLDLFSNTAFENDVLIDVLSKKFPGFLHRSAVNPIGVFGFIDDVKVDFVKHSIHPPISEIELIDGIRFFGNDDIAAMKINAILKRAVKKDFWDIAELLKHYPLKHFIDCYSKKYPNQMLLISIPQAITYFADAEESEEPVSLNGQTWEDVKKFISQKVSDYLK